jgi:serine/threonine-protein kinase
VHYREAVHFAELTRFVTSPALRWDDDFEALWQHPIDRKTLPAHLFRISLERETGMLVLRDGIKRKKIYFVEGAPEFVASTDKRELLGEHLIARGQVLRMEVDMALAMLPRFGGRLGDALVGLGVLRPVELFRAIHEQMQARFLEVYSWRAGEMRFVRGARSHEETFPLSVDPYELATRAVREAYSDAEINGLLAPIWDKLIAPVVLPPIRLEAFRLSQTEARVLRRVDGKLSLAALAKEKIADVPTIERAIFMGLSFQLASVEGWE